MFSNFCSGFCRSLMVNWKNRFDKKTMSDTKKYQEGISLNQTHLQRSERKLSFSTPTDFNLISIFIYSFKYAIGSFLVIFLIYVSWSSTQSTFSYCNGKPQNTKTQIDLLKARFLRYRDNPI